MKHLIIGVIGSGAMGSGIAQVAAMAGHKVMVYDANEQALIKAKHQLETTLQKLEEKGKIPSAEAIYNLIYFVDDLSSFDLTGLVIEAIVEDLSVKQKVFAELENHVSDRCILASNTSSLSITSIAAACRIPNRVVGVHFFNPAPLMPLVEIIPGLQTHEYITKDAKMIVDSWNKVTVLAKDTPGFIVNRVARSFYGESIRLYEEGIADMPTIDWALRTFGGFKMGPFELMDFIGNDINYKVTETVWEQFFYDPRFKPSLTQKRLYEAKRFGKKVGRGYYDYAEGAVMPKATEDEKLGKLIFNRVIAMLINEAADTLYLNIASKEHLDLAMTKGVNYPKGLLAWADEIGIDVVLAQLDALYEDYREDRYRACVLLRRMVKEKKRFY